MDFECASLACYIPAGLPIWLLLVSLEILSCALLIVLVGRWYRQAGAGNSLDD